MLHSSFQIHVESETTYLHLFCLFMKLKTLLFQTFWSEFLSHSCFQPLASTQSTENQGNRKEEWRTGTPRRTGGGTLFSLDLTSSSAPWSWTTQAASRNWFVSLSNVRTNFHPSVICWCQYSGDLKTRNSPLPLISMHYYHNPNVMLYAGNPVKIPWIRALTIHWDGTNSTTLHTLAKIQMTKKFAPKSSINVPSTPPNCWIFPS